MPSEITTAFVQQYRDTIVPLAQQPDSRLQRAVRMETGIRGEAYYVDQIGKAAGQEVLDRHGDSPINDTPHSRRRVDPRDFDWGELVDDPDKRRMLLDPTSSYLRNARRWAGRRKDKLIIDAAFADAKTGKTGSATTSFPASQQVAVDNHDFDSGTGNVGLTVGKLIAARDILGKNEADGLDEVAEDGTSNLFIVCSQTQISNLLTATEVTSRDFNTIQALVRGEINTFMGFEFIRSGQMLEDGNSHERVMAFHRDGIALGMWEDVIAEVTQRADKRYYTYAYLRFTANATRVEEERVVEIKCTN